MDTLKSLGLNETDGWTTSLNELIEWNLITTVDLSCTGCSNQFVLISKNLLSEFPGNFKIICVNCFKLKDFSDLNLEQQHVLTDRYKLISNIGIDIIADSFGKLLRVSSKMSEVQDNVELKLSKVAANIKTLENLDSPFKKAPGKPFPAKLQTSASDLVDTTLKKGEEDGAIPPGYRSVAWIRQYEAHAIKHSFEIKSDHKIKNDSGDVVFECLYFADDSFEVRKFKSNVQAVRINGQNRRVVGWIRREEAKAVIEADENRADVEFGHIKAGNGGLIQFFPEHLEVAKKYRSTTRLLRKD
jgi:hypothetical protein